jgi:hypothetical protein
MEALRLTTIGIAAFLLRRDQRAQDTLASTCVHCPVGSDIRRERSVVQDGPTRARGAFRSQNYWCTRAARAYLVRITAGIRDTC